MALNYHRALETRGAQVLSVGIEGSWFDKALADTPGALARVQGAVDQRDASRLREAAPAGPSRVGTICRLSQGLPGFRPSADT